MQINTDLKDGRQFYELRNIEVRINECLEVNKNIPETNINIVKQTRNSFIR